MTPGSDRGERVAAGLRTLLANVNHGPVLLVGTIWPEYWDTLMRRFGSDGEDAHPQARELLTGNYIRVPDSFDNATLVEFWDTSRPDPRLVEAASRATDGELTQYLAGGPALLERYEAAPEVPKSLITAAMDLRRLGHGPTIPISLLEAVTPAYLTDRQWHVARRDADWLIHACRFATELCHGAQGPLMQVWSRPGHTQPVEPSYQLADYLDQLGRRERRRVTYQQHFGVNWYPVPKSR